MANILLALAVSKLSMSIMILALASILLALASIKLLMAVMLLALALTKLPMTDIKQLMAIIIFLGDFKTTLDGYNIIIDNYNIRLGKNNFYPSPIKLKNNQAYFKNFLI
ncbi:hypothetical protein J2X97_001775 [Epilithonimonas hungarica]|uniref:hypothetical protein n=1 Tax=Epilithonimonas hungarica TaxID=454006 RepID=UPI00277EB45C|nr:hypothetical protein [Epilithonimonas hungarica]MDP9956138.1 hypothetical protein [Epilithonimonas hungarica]